MKAIFLTLALLASLISVNAQEQSSTGDLFNGLTRPLTFNRMIPPYALEVTFDKTVHILFPAAIRYVDLGSADLPAAKADGAENVLRLKAATRRFKTESNVSAITDLGGEPPYLVRLIMESIHKNNRAKIKHIGSRNFGIQCLLKGIYSHNDLLFFHLALKNKSAVSFDAEYVVFKIVDKKVAKRTAIREQVIVPLRSYNRATSVAGGREERTVFALPRFTIPNDKRLIIELIEKEGGRNQTLTVENADLIRVKTINNLQVRVK